MPKSVKTTVNQTEGKNSIVLLPPAVNKNSDLFNAFDMRQTIREISCAGIAPQLLSDLLWSAYGVNRRPGPFKSVGRTAASASNSQEILLYVATPEGAYIYDAYAHRLVSVSGNDLRSLALTPGQKEVRASAPVQLVYVVDLRRLTNTIGFDEPGLHDPEVQKSYYFVDTGLIAQNVYLFAAVKGLAAWFHNCDKEGLAQALNLTPRQKVLFAQSIGYPAVV
jgi:hypothetical protein